MKDFSQLKRNLKKDFSQLKKVRVAVLGDTATQFLTQMLRAVGFEYKLGLEIWEADYNQIEQQVFNSTSHFYEFNPDVVVIFKSSHKLLQKYNIASLAQRDFFAEHQTNMLRDISVAISQQIKVKIIYYNYPEIDDAVFGSYANKTPSSFLFQLRKLNIGIMSEIYGNPNLFLCDLSSIQNKIGKDSFFPPALYVNADMALSFEALPIIAYRTLDIISAFTGGMKKCIILDLDNTLWGGIIGDDGMENIQIGGLGIGKAFTEFQHWVKKLKDRGILVAVCSKNTESIAKEPFEKHPDMILRLEDIAVFVANWESKVQNISDIRNTLNIGFDSMVFIDDNPFERNLVRESIPEICVPEMPEDPAAYLEFLYGENLFETISFSNEDMERTKLYQIENQRNLLKQKFTNEDEFLKNLEMKATVRPFDKFNTPRVSQLSQRSNQFNLRTIRYTESEIELLRDNSNYFTITVSLKDKFADNGLICVVILKKTQDNVFFIESWFMSCRILKRGVENLVLNIIVEIAKEQGVEKITGEYIPTPKNIIVKDHYRNLGFTEKEGYWYLPTATYIPKMTAIEIIK